MQAKQQSLLERVDALDEECDELQKQLEEKEDAQSSLNKRLQDIYKLKEQQEAQLSQQQVNESACTSMTQRIQSMFTCLFSSIRISIESSKERSKHYRHMQMSWKNVWHN